jgi:hypothetical protein
MPERRRTKRRSISYYMRVIDVGSNQVLGHLADITLQGLKMDSQKAVPVPKDFRLRIYTTADVSDKEYIEFFASSRWCQIDPLEPSLYDVGFEIIRIDPHDAAIVSHIVDKYTAKESNFIF